MKDKDEETLRLDDPVWIVKSDGSLSGAGTIVRFSKRKRCCHVTCGGKLYKRIYSKEITLWK